jgi:hypothetical protein
MSKVIQNGPAFFERINFANSPRRTGSLIRCSPFQNGKWIMEIPVTVDPASQAITSGFSEIPRSSD